MRSEKLYNVLEGFDFELLNDPEFKEDSVREEIVVPIVKALGYSAQQPFQIIRSRNLTHPFVSIGSQQKKINIIPDYLFEVNNTPAWILDAKSPLQSIVKSKHVEQAYSYAIHSEVRVDFFSLCNGKEFALYHIQKVDPIMYFSIKELSVYWGDLKKVLSPERILNKSNLELAKDLGLHLKRLGFDEFNSLIFPSVPITHIGQLDNNMFTTSSGTEIEGSRYAVSFDFDLTVLKQLIGKIPNEAIEKLLERDPKVRKSIAFADTVFYINIDCRVGEKFEENDKEIFLPLQINRIIS
ncbi:type I restriction enzyme HsdR N-terminal domain-containing protein [Fluviicola taffensis]|uniref:Uncharacterized protein n=1 Tax=Fluviicola taffensis (strain DSM 16823 / NCIMB 13979 / RW262) TaxID=755732 RepID=F2IDF1_FLUTR|nr:type I restriction enzyme HsdR N-terminal domain-containing protein [Fluviicola taffensis]AEA42327.1 hypothetical protein Fluta_0318 [Fluviicola taffensis DSM 16823]